MQRYVQQVAWLYCLINLRDHVIKESHFLHEMLDLKVSVSVSDQQSLVMLSQR